MGGRIVRPEGGVNKLAFPRIGHVKTGMKKDNGYPTSVDYFIPTGRYKGLFTQVYGDRPNVIQIMFPDDDPALVCEERYEYRDGDGRLYAKGDGENFNVWDGKVYQQLKLEDYPNLMSQIQKKHPNRKVKKGLDGWEVVLTLNFLTPLIRGIAGYWSFSTKGAASTIPQIRNLFDEVLSNKGHIKGILFDLSVQFATSQKPNIQSRYPVVSLIPNESDENIQKIKGAKNPLQLK